MKILLVQPRELRKWFYDAFLLFTPLSLETISAPLRPNHDVRILDLRLQDDPEQALNSALEEFLPDVVAATALTSSAHSAFNCLKQAKLFDANIITIIGGQHVSLCPEGFESPYVDVVVVGEGDDTFKNVIETIELKGYSELGAIAGIAYRNGDLLSYTSPRGLIKNLDALPFPARDLTEKDQSHYKVLNKGRWLFIESTRGCPYRCDFCAVWKFHRGTYRLKSPERTVAEIESMVGHVDTVFFADDNFLGDLNRARTIAQLLATRNFKLKYYFQARTDTIVKNGWLLDAWKDVGLDGVYLGFEASKVAQMRNIGAAKSPEFNIISADNLRKKGIFTLGSFIISPNFRKEDFAQLRRHIDELNASMLTFFVLTPYPGTQLYDRTKHMLITSDYRLYDGIHTVLPTKLDRAEFYEEFASLFAHFWRRKNKDYLLWKMPIGPTLHWLRHLKLLNQDHEEVKESFLGPVG